MSMGYYRLMESSAETTARLPAAPEPSQPNSTWATRVAKVFRFAAHRAGEEQLLQVASSLTLTTVLAIVPLLAIALSLFTAFPVFQDFRIALEDFLATSVMPPAVSENIMDYLNRFASQASRLTVIGGAFLLLTSLMLIMTIDKTFNDLWHVRHQRPLPQRALVYWGVVTLGPVLAGASLWATSIIARESLGLVRDVPHLVGVAVWLIPLLLTGIGFAALFVTVPNRRVYWKDALAGGFGTALVLEAMKTGFAFWVTSFPTYMVIYGTFATLPLFLLWIYLSWLAVLFGATVAASLPLIRLGRWEVNRAPGAGFIDALSVLVLLYEGRGRTPPGYGPNRLATLLHLHHDELNDVMEVLHDFGMVARTQEQRWILACDPAQTSLGLLFDRFVLDRNQPRLRSAPELRGITEAILCRNPPPTLEDLMRERHNSDVTEVAAGSADILRIEAAKKQEKAGPGALSL
jgi:membrane protein